MFDKNLTATEREREEERGEGVKVSCSPKSWHNYGLLCNHILSGSKGERQREAERLKLGAEERAKQTN